MPEVPMVDIHSPEDHATARARKWRTPPTGPMDWPITLYGDDYWGQEVDCDVCDAEIVGSGPYTLDELADAITAHMETCVTSARFVARYVTKPGGQ